MPISSAKATEENVSGVSWAAIFSGAAAAAALSLILVILGFGLGFSAVSPWPSSGASATTISISTAIWLALTQILASGLGGYLAGRLRVRWTDVQSDEVYFRDTAHGMLSWAVATLVTAAFLGSAVSGIASGGAQAAGTMASTAAPLAQSAMGKMGEQEGGGSGPVSYFVDSLFRSENPPTQESPARAQAEATTIFLRSMSTGTLEPNDKIYLGRLVAQRTGLSQPDAEKRIDDLFAQAQRTVEETATKARELADEARKAAAATALWAFVALLCGAFFASLAAVWGGRRRDSAVA
ncbi:hypothetical protein EKL30_04045 [Candidimonas sp. SYP-B2681]|nr:hypothetical protein EKL30_04045 [Candidimonas sp. SYP-B2681]